MNNKFIERVTNYAKPFGTNVAKRYSISLKKYVNRKEHSGSAIMPLTEINNYQFKIVGIEDVYQIKLFM